GAGEDYSGRRDSAVAQRRWWHAQKIRKVVRNQLLLLNLCVLQSRKDIVFIVLAGIFITNAVTAEMIGGKLIDVGPYVMSVGILPWPVVFVTTDLINEYFGKDGVRKLSIITAFLIAYCF